MKKEIIEKLFNIQITDYQLIKTIDTIVYKIINNQKQIYILKLYKVDSYFNVDKIKEVTHFLNYLAKNVSFPLQSTPFLDFPTLEWEGEMRRAVLCNWIDGETPKNINTELCFKVGQMMAEIHLASETFSTKLNLLELNNDFFQKTKVAILKNGNLDTNEKVLLNQFFDKIKPFFDEIEDKNYGLIHTDLHFENMILNENILSPIDFDEVAYGHYSLDIAYAYNEMEWYKNANLLKNAFQKGYLAIRPLEQNFKQNAKKFQAMAACLFLSWYYDDSNEDVRKKPNSIKFAKKMMQKMLKF